MIIDIYRLVYNSVEIYYQENMKTTNFENKIQKLWNSIWRLSDTILPYKMYKQVNNSINRSILKIKHNDYEF